MNGALPIVVAKKMSFSVEHVQLFLYLQETPDFSIFLTIS